MESAIASDLALHLTLPGVSDPYLRLVLLAGIGAILASLAMLAAIVVLRLGMLARRRREQRFIAAWRPLMVQCLESMPRDLPPVAAADHEAFLRLWNYYHESLRGAAKERLNELAARAGMDVVARAMLGRRSLRDRLIAAVSLGNLGDKTAWHDLRRLAGDASPLLSLAAARSMLRIEPAITLQWLVPLAAERRDWPLARIAAMLAEAGVDRVTPALAAALEAAASREGESARLSRLLRLTGIADSGQVAPAVRSILEGAGEARVIADGLSALRDPRDVDLARRHTVHASWMVRVAAAKALGRLGTPEDCKMLTAMLGDPNWWVRHRAAHALAGLPFVGLEELRKIRVELTDRFAGQALDHVMAEKT